MPGTHALKVWSKIQVLIVLSSGGGGGGSELYAALEASAEALGVLALFKDFSYTAKGGIWVDVEAALSIMRRKGLGKTRYIEILPIWGTADGGRTTTQLSQRVWQRKPRIFVHEVPRRGDERRPCGKFGIYLCQR